MGKELKNFNNKNMIDEWLEKYDDPKISHIVTNQLAIAVKLHKAIKKQDIDLSILSKSTDIPVEKIKYFLTGTENISLTDLLKLDYILDLELFNV